MKKVILLGDEALALGGFHAGLSVGYSYPGTPASEIMEYLLKISKSGKSLKALWCVNEKVAYEEALGVSFAGKRAMVSMKHVGLNVAADPFMNSAITGTNGGLVLAVADDPGMHSSQNEQDSRYYAQFAKIFCFEPANHQEAYDMTRLAFDISEEIGVPVMIRMVTRLSHSRSLVKTASLKNENTIKYGEGRDWTLLPVNARRRFKILNDVQTKLKKVSNDSKFNSLDINQSNKSLGVIASGIAYNYVMENFLELETPPSFLKISTYPLPDDLIKELVDHVDSILVVEEGYPYIESHLNGILGLNGKNIRGKLNGTLPVTGELSSDSVRHALEMKPKPHMEPGDFKLPGRPPQLCKGCPHADTFDALNKALENYPNATVFSDIGCYTLGALPPYKAVDTCVCMGASVSMAKGGAEAGIYPSMGVIGDSTFAHSGMTPLLDAASASTNMVLVIVDNACVAMTGLQPSFSTGGNLVRIVKGLGVEDEHVRVIVPLPKNLEKNIQVMKEEIEYEGLSVIIAARKCIQELKKKRRSQ